MPRAWRLLIDGAASGPWNMGVDEALLATAVSAGMPTLRFYTWDGFWLSLGYGQTLPAERRAACRAAGVGVVRRVTGGRAVLHGADLTYAVAAPEGMLPAGLRETYEKLSQALQAGLGAVGIPASGARRPAGPAREPAFDCFSEAAGDELCVNGRKLVGSAQRRARGGVLQHGSIRLKPEPAPVRGAAGLTEGRSTSIGELGFEGTTDELLTACVAAFSEGLEADLEGLPLEKCEIELARKRSEEPEAAFLAIP